MIEGSLTTFTPVRIGDGGARNETDVRDKKTPFEVSTIAVDQNDRPYIPGPTLKGNIREWAASRMAAEAFEMFFGRGDLIEYDGVAGKAEFWNAPCSELDTASIEKIKQWTPYWNADRYRGVVSSTAINRRTRTVREKKLFHQEYVPPGVAFKVTITGQDSDDDTFKGDDGIIELLSAMEAFNEDCITLGSHTDDGWGRMRWKMEAIRRIDCEGLAAWISKGSPGAGYAMLDPLPPEKIIELEAEARKRSGERSANRSHLTIDLRLECEEHFGVNDPYQTGEGPQLSDHAPLRDADGRPILPGRSIRGAIRSRAEAILRTMDERLNEGRGGKKVACHPDDPADCCDAVYEMEEVDKLCLACRIFGAAGWRSTFKREAFVSRRSMDTSRQEFVAIDRFTGGGADRKKFNADSFHRPELRGAIGFDLGRLEKRGSDVWALGLIALTLRDLMEGDIHVGFGASKGYAAVRASIEKISLPSRIPGLLIGARFGGGDVIRGDELQSRWNQSEGALADCVRALEQAVEEAAKESDNEIS